MEIILSSLFSLLLGIFVGLVGGIVLGWRMIPWAIENMFERYPDKFYKLIIDLYKEIPIEYK
jgi:hypothetical protein